jgi:hypothetical protein
MITVLTYIALVGYLSTYHADESQRVEICDLATNDCVIKYVNRDKYGNLLL